MTSPNLKIQQTPTGYWAVQRGAVEVASAMTRKGAEAERELLARLTDRHTRRAAEQAAKRG